MAKKIDLNGLEFYKGKENAMIADEYSSSSTYAVGDYAYHAGTLYKCTTAITTAEAWTSGHWTAAKLAEDVTSQSEKIDDLENALIPSTKDTYINGLLINTFHPFLVNYDYNTPSDYKGDSTAHNSTCLSHRRYKQTIYLNSENTATSAIRLRISGTIWATVSNSTIDGWEGMQFKNGHKYKVMCKKLSGKINNDENGYLSVAVYKHGTHLSVGDVYEGEDKWIIREFVADTSYYTLALYIAANYNIQNAEFLILMEDVTEEEYGVEDYFASELVTTASSVQSAKTEPCLAFAVCTDIHYASHDTTVFPKTARNIKALSEQVKLDGVWCLGDVTDGDQTKATTADRVKTCMNLLMDTGLPVYFTAGNHDDNAYASSGANYFTTSEMFKNYYSFTDIGDSFDSGSYGVNFYKDYDGLKIRMISLDGSNSDSGSDPHYRYPADTVNWFVNIAMATVPEGYMVVLFTHLSPIDTHNWNSTVPNNASDVVTALNTFVNGGGKLVCIFGHAHADYSFDTPWLDICVCGNKADHTGETVIIDSETQPTYKLPIGAKVWQRTVGTATEDCWDVAIIKPLSRTINMIRFGAGEDRSFTY